MCTWEKGKMPIATGGKGRRRGRRRGEGWGSRAWGAGLRGQRSAFASQTLPPARGFFGPRHPPTGGGTVFVSWLCLPGHACVSGCGSAQAPGGRRILVGNICGLLRAIAEGLLLTPPDTHHTKTTHSCPAHILHPTPTDQEFARRTWIDSLQGATRYGCGGWIGQGKGLRHKRSVGWAPAGPGR